MHISKKVMDDFENYCRANKFSEKQRAEKLELLKKLVEKYMYEPGEAIGVVAAQSISEPATQMSLDSKEKIIIKNTDTISIQEIGEFTDTIIERLGVMHEDDWDIADLADMDIYVPSINQQEKIEWKKVLACSRHESPKKLLRIKTLSGRKITATNSHSFVIRKNNQITAVSGKSLNAGERIPSIKMLPENCIKEVNIKDIAQDKFMTARKKLPEMMPLNETAGWLFGAYLSEGNCTVNYTNISNTDKNFLENTRRFASDFGLTTNEYDNTRGFALGHDVRINSSLLSEILTKTCGKGSSNKKVPMFSYSAEEPFIKGLLKAYFDGDGNVSVERGVIRASSDSKELLDGIALLLNRFGIFSYKSKGKQYNLVIPGKHAKTFREKIGFASDKKKQKLDDLCKTKPARQDFIELISGFDDLLLKTSRKLGYPARYVNSFTKRQRIGKEALLKYITIFSQISKEKQIDINKELSVMKTMHASDVIWDEIAELEYVKSSSKYVYDLTVEGTETFTTFEGIVTHNTMRSYTMASQSDRLSKVTHGLPRLIEIFDARKSFEKNMTIYMLPDYNTKEKAKEIAGVIKSKTVGNMIISDSIDLVNLRIELELEKESYKDGIKFAIAGVKEMEITSKSNMLYLKPKKDDVKNLRKIKNKILKTQVDGIKGIENVIVVKENEDWVLQTIGSNLKKVLKIEGVDINRTATNDIYQIYDVLGVEAARNTILKEAKQTLDEQGLEVDVRHLMLLADMMTFDGEVRDIGRYGVSGKKASVLARANFEETKKHIVHASFFGETDNLQGIIENIMIGQIPPIGTGMVQLGIDAEKMKAMVKKK